MMVRTDPFRQLDRLSSQLLGNAPRPATMPIDAYRKGDEFVVAVDLPGIDPDTIDLTVDKQTITIRAERRRNADEGVEYVVGERPYGTFTRRLFLGKSLDTADIQADYRDGVLSIHVPVAEEAKPRKVKVGGSATPPEIKAA
jgi:HSP20 family protein